MVGDVPGERELGIAAGLAWLPVAHATVVYTDRGISPGMHRGIRAARLLGIPIEWRSVTGDGVEDSTIAVEHRGLARKGLPALHPDVDIGR